MACKVTMTLLTESQQGNIGDDWKYTLEAKVFNQGLKGKASISVPKHKLSSGATQEPPGPPAPVAAHTPYPSAPPSTAPPCSPAPAQ